MSPSRVYCAVFAIASAHCMVLAAPIALNFSATGQPYDGIGALSGGGGVTRLLLDYPEAQRTDILDALFTPGKGASLQIIKVEIGGDTQSTEGTEQTHERIRGDFNCSRGYEWFILQEALKRNPGIITYGLSWGVPGWIGDGNGDGVGYFSGDNIKYHVDWLACAANKGIQIQWLGIWNERSYDINWVKNLRSALDAAGFATTRIIAADNSWSVADDMVRDATFAAAIDVVGAHYPGSAPPSAAVAALPGKGWWASEMWNLGSVDDYPGAGVLAADLNQHAMWGLSSSILWCLIYSWYAILPFSSPRAGTNAGAGHSILTAAEPWSGHWELNPQIAVMAHHTQFAKPGWTYLAPSSTGMGTLVGGGTYITVYNERVPLTLEMSLVIQTFGAKSIQNVEFALTGFGVRARPQALHVWLTNETSYFVQIEDVIVAGDGTFSLQLAPNAIYSVTTTTGQGGAVPAHAIPPPSPFPFPYSDTFEGYAIGAYARYFSDEGGVFVVAQPPQQLVRPDGGAAFAQVVSVIPIAWETNPNPYTLIGNFNRDADQAPWTDYAVSVLAALDPSASAAPAAKYVTKTGRCAANTLTQQWRAASGDVNLTLPTSLQSVVLPGMCLGLMGPSTVHGSAMVLGLVNCSDTTLQWSHDSATGELVTSVSRLCVDIWASNASLGADTIAYPCNGGQNEQWRIVPVEQSSPGALSFVSALGTGDLCLDLQLVAASAPFLLLSGRINTYTRGGPPPDGYTIVIAQGVNATAYGTWTLSYKTATLAHGTTPVPITSGTWYKLGLLMRGTNVTATLNDAVLVSVTDSRSTAGMVAIGSGWHLSWFDDFNVTKI